MIFVSVGTQFPFDRLIRCVDTWAVHNTVKIVAQIGMGQYKPEHMNWEGFMDTEVFLKYLRGAEIIISHAGMGNIITALDNHKPIIIMNRRHELGEHRNNHQGEGLVWMKQLPGVYPVQTCSELVNLLNHRESLQVSAQINQEKRQKLIDFIDREIRS